MKRDLFLTVGLPRSGKSTWAKQKGWPIVNPDSIRLAIHGERYNQLAEPYVWAVAETMVRSLFLAGHDRVILDATNISEGRRKRWKTPDWITRFVPVTTDKLECIRRAVSTNDEYIVSVIERMARDYEPLTPDERLMIYETVEPCPYKDSEENIVGFQTSGRLK